MSFFSGSFCIFSKIYLDDCTLKLFLAFLGYPFLSIPIPSISCIEHRTSHKNFLKEVETVQQTIITVAEILILP